MNKKKELAKNTIVILIGKICTQFISFFLLPLYTAVLDSSEFGIVDLVTTYVALLVPLITLQLEQALFRYLVDVREKEDEKSCIISSVLITVLIQIILCTIVFLVINIFFDISYKYFIIINIIATIFSSLALQTARGLGDNKSYSIGSVIAGAMTVVFNVIFLVVLEYGPSGMFLSSILANSLCVLFILIKNRLYKLIKLKNTNKATIKKLLKYSIPLIPNGLIWWVINVSDRTIITAFLGIASNGIYAISNKFSGVFINVYNIFNLSWTESAALHIDDEDRDEFFTSTIRTMFNFFSALCLGIIALMPFVFPVMVNVQYTDSYNYIPILMTSTLFNIIVGLYSVVYVAKKLTKKISQTSFMSGIINIVINLILIKYIGIWAAAISTLVAFATMAIYRYIDVQKYVNAKLGKSTIIRTIIMFIITIVVYYTKNYILCGVNVLLVIIYSVYINRTIIKEVINTMLKKIKKL